MSVRSQSIEVDDDVDLFSFIPSSLRSQLRTHQVEGVSFLLYNMLQERPLGCLLADSMGMKFLWNVPCGIPVDNDIARLFFEIMTHTGLGKTIQIWTMLHLFQQICKFCPKLPVRVSDAGPYSSSHTAPGHLPPNPRVLIVCPVSVISHWLMEKEKVQQWILRGRLASLQVLKPSALFACTDISLLAFFPICLSICFLSFYKLIPI
jgi:hypothetical protein